MLWELFFFFFWMWCPSNRLEGEKGAGLGKCRPRDGGMGGTQLGLLVISVHTTCTRGVEWQLPGLSWQGLLCHRGRKWAPVLCHLETSSLELIAFLVHHILHTVWRYNPLTGALCICAFPWEPLQTIFRRRDTQLSLLVEWASKVWWSHVLQMVVLELKGTQALSHSRQPRSSFCHLALHPVWSLHWTYIPQGVRWELWVDGVAKELTCQGEVTALATSQGLENKAWSMSSPVSVESFYMGH